VIPATRAAKTFGQLVDRVRESQAVYIVERAGRAVAQIGPVERQPCTVAELVSVLKGRGAPGADFRREVKAGVTAGNKRAVPGDPWAR
jgi:antitoxin (DNA-binding transcriptional repressor) of toxin-antitoxin stability system